MIAAFYYVRHLPCVGDLQPSAFKDEFFLSGVFSVTPSNINNCRSSSSTKNRQILMI